MLHSQRLVPRQESHYFVLLLVGMLADYLEVLDRVGLLVEQ